MSPAPVNQRTHEPATFTGFTFPPFQAFQPFPPSLKPLLPFQPVPPYNDPVSQTVFWHRELPPLDGEVVAEHFLEATSDHVSGSISFRDEL